MKSKTSNKYNFKDKEFDDIRPLFDNEVKESITQLLKDEKFKAIAEPLIKPITWEYFYNQMRGINTIYEFQTQVIYNILTMFIEESVSKLTLLNPKKVDLNKSHTFISNHRDIVLDAAFLNISLNKHGYETTEVAIGDNLLIYPWISTLVRLNKSFIVKRNMPIRQILKASQHLSNYLYKTINEKNQSVWIAQREGRAKDSDDRTQTSLIKMFTLRDRKNPVDSVKALNIVPLSISYEYDPCDFLKAKESLLIRNIEGYKKTKDDDLFSMLTGIKGYKGRICFRVCKPLNDKIDSISTSQENSVLLQSIADLIDEEIFKNYEIYTINYIAYDILNNTNRFTNKYSKEEKEDFITYVNKQVDKIEIENKDVDFLKTSITEMYANILINHLSVQE